ncbi:MAG: serine/threonine protein kinase [Roseofilum sp. SID3]|uniref:serine/threonine-protein kinase n=1 Tax=unclassified Roseofilum TaxID=2620099 RepID=UPI001AFDA02B|nr:MULTISPECIES: serine/threonine-protein kinase [unclassified Roseofilum]MBP0013466.1 serine/threonine protein kinase [Roseofilum sp. SID3]MBP0040245.1 serine/threonine protein kinase [Roseofilum sp. SID1]
MSSPLGLILQHRYRLVKLLGQGGFGCTYLAEDLGRFNELCAIKEFVPSARNPQGLQKAEELFQREATILYKLQHAQVPQFRANFEEEGRLFLVQDYVEGKSYQTLLDERTAQGHVFAEDEVKTFLAQVLPVLGYLHSQGVIHRDIAPDNMMWRQRDGLPVLIDFGVGKELATQLCSETGTLPTTVGKVGYAPREQLQMGLAYPSSDFYALGVTVLVLLTGKEPGELFDPQTLSWKLPSSSISPQFTQILERLLAEQPGDRFPSADRILHVLGGATVLPRFSEQKNQALTPQYTQSQYQSSIRSSGAEPMSASKIAMIGAIVALVAGITSWMVVSAWLRQDRVQTVNPGVESPASSPSPFPSPSVSPSPFLSPSPSPTPLQTPNPPGLPTTYQERLTVTPGEVTRVEGSLKANEVQYYLISAQEGDRFSMFITGDGVLMTLLTPEGEAIGDRSTDISLWEGEFPISGEYAIIVSPLRGLQETDYQLEIEQLNVPVEPTPEPELTPEPTLEPELEINSKTIQFAPGTTGIEINSQSNRQQIQRYLLRVRKDQIMQVKVIEGNVTLNIRYPTGELIPEAYDLLYWESQVPESGEYIIDVLATESTDFSLDISVTDQ